MGDQKPELFLLRGDQLTAEKVALLFEKLTGRKVSEDEIARFREKLASRGFGKAEEGIPPPPGDEDAK